MVSIAAFQAVDPGSIPGRRNRFFFSLIEETTMKTESSDVVSFPLYPAFLYLTNEQTVTGGAQWSRPEQLMFDIEMRVLTLSL